MAEPTIVPCKDLDDSIDQYYMQGYRMAMITPADAPREVLLTKGSQSVLLRSKNLPRIGNKGAPTGRAGMIYHDLIPGRMEGKLIASRITLPFAGEVPDSVHYHKIDFQMIYCVRGRIQVVYEDQGPPFWLESGDCVLQPPAMRHRVLFSEAGAEVIEVSSPAEHETWIEHDMELPTRKLDTERMFSGSRFVWHRAKDAGMSDDGERDTGIAAATGGRFDVQIRRNQGKDTLLLLQLRGLGPEGHGTLAAPVAVEIPV